jgi:hypothetical protein
MADVELTLFTVAPFLGGFIGIGLALISMWHMITSVKRNQKIDMDNSNKESENRLKEFFNLKFEHMNERMLDIKEDVQNIDTKIHTKEAYFTTWIQRVEQDADDERRDNRNNRQK